MGYICIVCGEIMSMKTDPIFNKSEIIVTTICGHLFHQECLTKSLERKHSLTGLKKNNPHCPACLRILDWKQHCIQIYPVESEESTDIEVSTAIEEIKATVLTENTILKRKLEALLEIVNTSLSNKAAQMEKNQERMKYENSSSTMFTARTDVVKKEESLPMTSLKSRQISYPSYSSKSEYDSSITTNNENVENLSDHSYETSTTDHNRNLSATDSGQCVDFVDVTLKENKPKCYKTRRREFLTSRNKVTSWLIKMNSKSQRLGSENIVSDTKAVEQQILESKLFLNKIEMQGILLDAHMKAAEFLITFEGTTPLEKNLTERCAIEIKRDYMNMHQQVCDRILNLEAVLTNCVEIHDCIEHSRVFNEDVDNRLRNILNKKKENGDMDKKSRIQEISSLLKITDSYRDKIEFIQTAKDEFDRFENAQLLPTTESMLNEVISRYFEIVKELLDQLKIANNEDCEKVKKTIDRRPVYV